MKGGAAQFDGHCQLASTVGAGTNSANAAAASPRSRFDVRREGLPRIERMVGADVVTH
jgi:hypothetical protein